MDVRAITLEGKKIYSYEKATLGSYKDYVPDHYPYGYLMAAYVRNKYDNDFFDKSISYIARKPYTIYPFYFGIKKNYNLSKNKLYNQTINYMDSLWTRQSENIDYTNYYKWNKINNKCYTSYRFPQYLNDSLIVCEKGGICQIDQFVLINKSGKEKESGHKILDKKCKRTS